MAAWEKSDIISAASAACAIFVFGFGIWQYRSSENWKRSEFVASQIKEFGTDKVNQAVLLMMDYEGVRIELFPDRPNADDRFVEVGLAMLVESLNRESHLPPNEFQIRQYFEHFLTSLSRFNYFLESGAIEPNELCADFGYPVELMTGDARDMKLKNVGIDIAPFSKALNDYLTRWDYVYVQNFLKKIQKACK